MKITGIHTLFCDAGWRPWIFIKITTDAGLVGWSECSDSHGSPSGIAGIIRDLSPHLIGQDPRAHESLYWTLYRATRQTTGGLIHKAIAGIENALLDIKGKSLGVPVYSLFGGPTRESVRAYWSHCGTTRVRSAAAVGKPPVASLEDVADLGREVVRRGFTALKTNILLPGTPWHVLMQGFRGGPGTSDQNLSTEVLDGLVALMGTFREAVGPKVDLCLDLNFNFKTEGNIAVARALAPFRLLWLELDAYNPSALREVRRAAPMPICSGEDLYTNRDYLPYFERQAMSVAAIDVLWNGFAQAKKVADLAEIHEMNVAPHNHYSHLATLISAQFCAAVPNVRILELDVDDVPWREELLTTNPRIEGGAVHLPTGPGWGADVNEEVLKAHPWPRT